MVQGENVVVVGGGCGGLKKKSVKMRASTREVIGIRRCVQGSFPSAMVVKLCSECFVGSFAETMCGEVERNG